MADLWYPKADNVTQDFSDDYPGVATTPAILLVHSTEGSTWPTYSGGAEAPNITYHPVLRKFRGHVAMNRSARSLMDPAGTPVRENRVCTQLEVIGTCDPKKKGTGMVYIPEMTSVMLDDIAALWVWCSKNLKVPLAASLVFRAYPGSYGSSNGVRCSSASFAAYKGLAGHMHASGNLHGDPGKFPAATLLAKAQGIANPRPKVSLAGLLKAIKDDKAAPTGKTSNASAVLPVEKALVAEGLLKASLADGSAGTSSFGPGSAYQRWQKSLGLTGAAADGIPGKTSLTALGKKRGFDVV